MGRAWLATVFIDGLPQGSHSCGAVAPLAEEALPATEPLVPGCMDLGSPGRAGRVGLPVVQCCWGRRRSLRVVQR